MKASIASAILAYIAAASAQGVTSNIPAPGAAPSGCAISQNGVFGIQVVDTASGAASGFMKRQNDNDNEDGSAVPVTQIGDGQIQASTAVQPAAPVTQINDGQVQAPTAVPVTQIGDGQVQAPTAVPVTQIGDGQVQAPTAVPVTQIGDGQIQAPTAVAPSMVTVTVTKNNCMASPITQIADGQIQAPMATPVTQIGDGQIQAPTGVPVTQIGDGQVQAPTGVPVSQIGDGQVQAPTATPVGQIGDGQVQATTLATMTRAASVQPTSVSDAGYAMLPGYAQACASGGTLQIGLQDSVLTDDQGRTGYVAANYQFQFDAPAQTGAIYTSGFSLCSNGSLALGGSTTFYQCLSGDFYNLYYYPADHSIPEQCQAVQIEAIQLNAC